MPIKPTQTVRTLVQEVQARNFMLPNIQRSFVWEPERTLKLLDSLMRGYPIGALLVWKPSIVIPCRNFVEDYKSGERLRSQLPAVPTNAFMVLDGQQRVQSLFLAFAGRYDAKGVYLKIDELAKDGELRYRFEYLSDLEAAADKSYLPLAELANIELPDIETFARKRLPSAAETVRQDIWRIVAQFLQTFVIKESLLLQEIKEDTDYNDVLEIFHRVNSGGVQLFRSDLLFSTVTFALPDMEGRFLDLVDDLNDGGRYNFDTDFVVKAVLVIFGMGAKYDANSLKNEKLITQLKDRFGDMEKAVVALRGWLVSDAKIRTSRFLYSSNALIPLLDYLMLSGQLNAPWQEAERRKMVEYLYMAFFARLFSYGVDNVLDQLHELMTEESKKSKLFPIERLREFIGRRAKVAYGFRDEYLQDLDLVLNCIVPGGVEQIPKKRGWSLERDHIFPQAELGRHNIERDVNDLGNLRLLAKAHNIAKSDTMPDSNTEFFGKDDLQLMELFDKTCGELTQENFSGFVARRKELIRKRVVEFLGV